MSRTCGAIGSWLARSGACVHILAISCYRAVRLFARTDSVTPFKSLDSSECAPGTARTPASRALFFGGLWNGTSAIRRAAARIRQRRASRLRSRARVVSDFPLTRARKFARVRYGFF
jgi:hypothetical protein